MFKSNRRGTTEDDGINVEDWPEEEIVDTGAIVPGPPPASVVKWDLASFQKPPKQQDGDGSAYGAMFRTSGTVASSLTADQRSSSSGGSGNVWTRLLGKDTNWDKLGDGFDDQGGEEGEGCQRATKTCTLTLWYELCHFAHTVWSNPHILLLSLATFGVLCGVGMAAVNSERDAYVEKQKGVATFVVSLFVVILFFSGSGRMDREDLLLWIPSPSGIPSIPFILWHRLMNTKPFFPLRPIHRSPSPHSPSHNPTQAMETAQWFSDEFRRAMLPLYSIQQGVIHSGFFDDLPALIGPYPELVVPESLDTPFTKRNVTGICDDPDMIAKWRDIVFPVNSENDLDGVVVGYRLFPANVACLTEPHRQESTQHFDAEAFPQGDALLASDNVFGLDAGQTAFPLWQMITTGECFRCNRRGRTSASFFPTDSSPFSSCAVRFSLSPSPPPLSQIYSSTRNSISSGPLPCLPWSVSSCMCSSCIPFNNLENSIKHFCSPPFSNISVPPCLIRRSDRTHLWPFANLDQARRQGTVVRRTRSGTSD
jgi:hypothetical protein